MERFFCGAAGNAARLEGGGTADAARLEGGGAAAAGLGAGAAGFLGGAAAAGLGTTAFGAAATAAAGIFPPCSSIFAAVAIFTMPPNFNFGLPSILTMVKNRFIRFIPLLLLLLRQQQLQEQ